MANAVFNSLESYFNKNKLKPNIEWAKFDLSNIRTLDMDMGILYPIYLEECIPADKFKISVVQKVQALPLKNPLMNNIKIYTYFYYVPYYLLWHQWDRFISGGKDGTYTVEPPYIKTCASGGATDNEYWNKVAQPFGSNTLWDYLGFEPIEINTEATEKPTNHYQFEVSAFPFRAYQRIYRDYFLNEDIETEGNINTWFPEDDLEWQLHSGQNIKMGEGETPEEILYPNNTWSLTRDNREDPWLTVLRPRNYNKDYFTSMWFSPQRGPAQAVPISGNIDFTEAIAPNNLTISNYYSDLSIGYIADPATGTIGNKISGTSGIGNTTAYGDKIKDALKDVRIASNGGFTLEDLHMAEQIEIWMERNMAVKAKYNEFLRIHFDDAPTDERLTKPQYIGGTVQDIKISEILQTSQTTEESAQGTATGHASAFGGDYVGKCYSHEYGLIMGLACIMPETYYETGMDRHWWKKSRYEYYFPEFANLEAQAILRKELYAPTITDVDDVERKTAWLNEVAGYVGRYDEYRVHKSLAVGALRDKNKKDFTSWVIKHEVGVTNSQQGNKPILNTNLICTHKSITIIDSPAKMFKHAQGDSDWSEYTTEYISQINHDAWETNKSMNPFIAQFGISVEAVRPMPYTSDPTKAKDWR